MGNATKSPHLILIIYYKRAVQLKVTKENFGYEIRSIRKIIPNKLRYQLLN